MSETKKYLGVPEAAAYIGVRVSTLYSYVNRRLISHYKPPGSSLVKFRVQDLDAWIDAGRVSTAEEALNKED